MTKTPIIPILILLFASFVSCTSLGEAQHTLVKADSLCVAGITYPDSVEIASAVATLSNYRYFYPADYAKANYYYGRLLRDRGNQVEAMQCFIDASHTDCVLPLYKRIGYKYRHIRTDENNLLGKVYCNIGIICHLAEDYQLSYIIFEKSANKFYDANNLTAYYYALNDMALELAEQNKQQETFSLLEQIESSCNDSSVLIKILETKAILYRNTEQYDSAILVTNKLLSSGYCLPTELMIKAQSFSYLNIKDSALFYANRVMETSNHYGDIYNALYILSNDDSTLTNQKLLELTSARDDIHTYEVETQKIKLAQSVQLLNQDMYSKPNYNWIIFILVILVLTIAIIITNHWHHKKRKEIEQEKEHANIYVRSKQQELDEIINKVNNEQQYIDKLHQVEQNHSRYLETILQTINNTCNAFQQSNDIKRDLNWNDYDTMCEIINKNFYMLVNKLKAIYNLNDREIRLCVLVFIGGFSSKQMAELLYYGESGIRNFKSNTAKKLGTNGKELRNFLVELVIKGRIPSAN